MSDRFFIIDKGHLPIPAKCWCCGAIDQDCIDWGADIAYQGAILLCIRCVAEAATLLEPPVDLEKEALKEELKAAKTVLGALRGNLVAVIDSGLIDVVAASASPVFELAGSNQTVAKTVARGDSKIA